MRIRFDKVDGITKIYNGTKYLELFGPQIYYAVYDRTNCLINEKNDAKYIINHNFARTRIDSCNSLPIQKTLTFHVIILITSVVNKNKNNSYLNTFLGKGSYEYNYNNFLHGCLYRQRSHIT